MRALSRSSAGCALVVLLVAASACGRDAREEFVQGRSEDPCLEVVPACPSVYASCVLDSSRYATAVFPSQSPFRFLVSAPAASTIAVQLFFDRQQFVGVNTSIYWYEPGCSDFAHQDSGGRNLFDEAEGPGYITREQAVQKDGEHLIEIFTDMQARVLIAITIREKS